MPASMWISKLKFRPRLLSASRLRRGFGGQACLLATAFLFSAPGGLYEVHEIKPHIFVWIADDVVDQEGDPEFSRAGTAGFIIAPDGVVVIDTTNSPFHGRELLFEIRRRTDAPIRTVINTDACGDHVLGNEVFVDQQANIVATPAALIEMRRYRQEVGQREVGDFRLQARLRGFHFTPPNRTFDSTLSLQIGDEPMQLKSVETDRADVVVYLPRAKVLFLGDLFENNFYPRVGARDIRRWIATLKQLETWDVETYVPGHGAPGDRTKLVGFRHFLEWLANQVEARTRQGKTLAQVKGELLPMEDYNWHAPERAAEAVESVYNQFVQQPAKP